MTKKRELFVLIDGNALIHRAYHAFPPTLTTNDGEQVNAVYGFASMLLRVLEDLKPEYIACAFDLPKPTFRHLEYVGYKADRRAPDKELVPQFKRVRDLVKALAIPTFEVEGYEADDVIGTLCTLIDAQDEKNQVDTIIVTGDRDTLQLVDKNTKVWLPGKTFKDMLLFGEKEVKEKFMLRPDQIIDYKALAGDASDQIPGVKGIGIKTATDLLMKYETLDNIYIQLEDIKESIKKKLAEDKENAYLSKKLATIIRDVPIRLNYEKAVVSDYDYDEALSFFQKMQFRSLIKRLPQSSRKSRAEGQLGLLNMSEDESNIEIKYGDDLKTLIDIRESAKKVGTVSYFTSGSLQKDDFNISFFTTESLPFRSKLSLENISRDIQKLLIEIFSDDKLLKVTYDCKLGLRDLQKLIGDIEFPVFDVMIAGYMLGFQGKNLSLESLSFTKTGVLLDEKNRGSLRYDIQGVGIVMKLYSIFSKDLVESDKDAGNLWKTLVKDSAFEKILSLPDYKIGVKDLFYNIETPLIFTLNRMESLGVLLDGKRLSEFGGRIKEQIGDARKDIFHLVGHEFNLDSPKQLSGVLFGELSLPLNKKTKTGYSTNASVLEELRPYHPAIEKIERYRELSKLNSTYIDGLEPLPDETGRIHTSYNQTVAITGRLSSSDPNLQNIPVRTEYGNEIRKAFVARQEGVFVSFDYSQIELRLVAHVAQEPKMLESFKRGVDIHATTASEIFDVSLEKVTKEERSVAKTVNFAILYGVSPYGLSLQLGRDPKECEKIINLYFEKYPNIRQYMDRCIEIAGESGYLETMFGRKARVNNIRASVFQLRKAAERFAINYPMQGSAAEIMKIAMIDTERYKDKFEEKDPGVKIDMLLSVHDEIIFEYSESGKTRAQIWTEGKITSAKLKEFVKKTKEVMEAVAKLSVPLGVEAEIGTNWGELSPIKE